MRASGYRKYRNTPVEFEGIRFDSQREMARWASLRHLQKAGVIRDLQRQVRIPLEGRDGPVRFQPSGRQAVYVADFTYFDIPRGTRFVEDAKGHPTPQYKLKRAILAAQGVEIMEV